MCHAFSNQSGGKWIIVRKILEILGTWKVEGNLEGVFFIHLYVIEHYLQVRPTSLWGSAPLVPRDRQGYDWMLELDILRQRVRAFKFGK